MKRVLYILERVTILIWIISLLFSVLSMIFTDIAIIDGVVYTVMFIYFPISVLGGMICGFSKFNINEGIDAKFFRVARISIFINALLSIYLIALGWNTDIVDGNYVVMSHGEIVREITFKTYILIERIDIVMPLLLSQIGILIMHTLLRTIRINNDRKLSFMTPIYELSLRKYLYVHWALPMIVVTVVLLLFGSAFSHAVDIMFFGMIGYILFLPIYLVMIRKKVIAYSNGIRVVFGLRTVDFHYCNVINYSYFVGDNDSLLISNKKLQIKLDNEGNTDIIEIDNLYFGTRSIVEFIKVISHIDNTSKFDSSVVQVINQY